jgi:hypothetical protein
VGVLHWEKGAAMAAWAQERDSAMPTMTAALLQMEVGDEAGTVVRLG